MKPGILYIVATPIGNLADFTYRGVEVLSSVTKIATEDTRHTAILLNHYGITTPCIAYHAHNEDKVSDSLIKTLKQGASIALVSDAGTPLINDPGYQLVHQARQEAIQVVPIPGACAAIAALSASGLPVHKFLFLGFLSSKEGAKMKQLQEVANMSVPIVIYEAPHRLLSTLNVLSKVVGEDRELILAKEITKRYENFTRGTVIDCFTWLKSAQIKGEWVLIISPATVSSTDHLIDEEGKRILQILMTDLPLKQASALAAQIKPKISKNLFYQWGLTCQRKI